MEIFKLFFEHDLRLDNLAGRNTGDLPATGGSIEDFLKPDPTYSKFYFSGSRLDTKQFGLTVLDAWPDIERRLTVIFEKFTLDTPGGRYDSLEEALQNVKIGQAILISESGTDHDPDLLEVRDDSNVGHFKSELAAVLTDDVKVLYKEKAHDGYDLHLFSKENIYSMFFYPFKELLSDSFRFFSINSKRVRSERQFYFETWSLERPPHGAEEVLPETAL